MWGDAERQRLDSRISVLQEEIRQLNEQRNEYSVTSCLPQELLTTIFILCSGHDTAAFTTRPPIVHITHVSRFWRETALGCPQIWASVTVPSPWNEAMLNRSQQLPISLELCEPSPGYVDDLIRQVLAEEPYRLRTLKIVGTPKHISQRLDDLAPSAPLLQTLIVRNTSSQAIDLPAGFLSNGFPLLREVELEGCKGIWTLTNMKGLTHLKISTYLSNAPGPTPAQFLQILYEMPALVALDLKIDIPELPWTTFTPLPIRLPHLEKLDLTAPVAACGRVLRCLALPPSVTIRLSWMYTDLNSQLPLHDLNLFKEGLVSAWLSDPLSNSQTLTIQSLQLGASARSRHVTRVWLDDVDFGGPDTLSPPPFTLTLINCSEWPPRLFQHVSESIVSVIPLDDLSSLSLVSKSKEFESLRVLCGLHSLKSITLRGNSAAQRFLVTPRSMPPSLGLPTFPHLELIHVIEVEFGTGYKQVNSGELVQLLEARKLQGREIKRLKIRSCINFGLCDVGLLENTCADVEWDGHWEKVCTPDSSDFGEDSILYGL
ncbi:hypothetical protein FA15DRAFT_675473 [Coprinopsis marcescibilis]|uniref:F-box domain-containing protein n=1 Tax=Coprinopsis marcescibilis TaxID=230819 RepID=A0A5C3KDP1_COPMA|nr:hypothetical protein FA15DRAFT_675473 [Coprinopsis marcescibilis]